MAATLCRIFKDYTKNLVFLHGFLGCKLDWEPYIKYFGGIAIDLPGHGDAPFYDLSKILPQKAHLVGYSMGGRIALEWLYRYPNRFPSATLLSTNLGLETEEEKQNRIHQEEMWIESIHKDGINHFIQTWYQNPLFEGAPIPAYRYQQNPDLLIQAIRKFSLAKQQNFWNSLPKSTTFLYGEQDRAYRKTYERLCTMGRDAHLIPKSSHAIHLQNIPACIEFIERSLHVNNNPVAHS